MPRCLDLAIFTVMMTDDDKRQTKLITSPLAYAYAHGVKISYYH